MPDTLADFLLARFDEGEAAVNAVDSHAWSELHYLAPGYRRELVIADLEVKRRIVRAQEPSKPYEYPWGGQGDHYDVLAHDWVCKMLALPYAHHPGFRPEWRL